MAEKPKRFVFDLGDEDRAALERVRVRLGLRSHAETLRALISDADAVGVLPCMTNIMDYPDGGALLPYSEPGTGTMKLNLTGQVSERTTYVYFDLPDRKSDAGGAVLLPAHRAGPGPGPGRSAPLQGPSQAEASAFPRPAYGSRLKKAK